jgi:hypothetical protein
VTVPGRAGFLPWSIGLFVLAAATYLALPTAHHSYDAVAYALDIERAGATGTPALWHDYHLLYNPLGLALQRVGRQAGFHPLMTLQMANAVAGALLVALLGWLLHAWTGRRLPAAAGALLVGFSGSFWYYCTNAEPYVPSALVLLLCVALLPVDEDRHRGMERTVVAAILFALAVGLHLSVIVLAPVCAAFLALAAAPAERWKRPAAFLAVALPAVAGLYAYKWSRVEGIGVPSGAVRLWQDFFAPRNPVTEVFFLVRPYNPAGEFAALLRAFAPVAETAGGHAGAWQAALRVIPAALSAAALWGTWRAVSGRRWRTLFTAACFAVLLLFFASYNPGEMKFTPFLTLFLVAAALLSLDELASSYPRAGRAALAALPALAILVAAGNFLHFIRPWTRDESNPPLLEALAARQATRPEDGVLLIGQGSRNALKVYVPYFGEREAIILDFQFNPGALTREQSFDLVRRRLQTIEARGGTVYAVADLVEGSPDRDAFLGRNRLAAADLNAMLGGLAPGPPVVLGGRPYLYPLRRAPSTSTHL